MEAACGNGYAAVRDTGTGTGPQWRWWWWWWWRANSWRRARGWWPCRSTDLRYFDHTNIMLSYLCWILESIALVTNHYCYLMRLQTYEMWLITITSKSVIFNFWSLKRNCNIWVQQDRILRHQNNVTKQWNKLLLSSTRVAFSYLRLKK